MVCTHRHMVARLQLSFQHIGSGTIQSCCMRVITTKPSEWSFPCLPTAFTAVLSMPANCLHCKGAKNVAFMQAAFTAKELREITKLPGVQVHIPQDALQLTDADRAELKASRIKKRVYDILKTASEAPKPK